MLKKHRWYLEVALALIAASAVLYLIDYSIFGDAHHLWIYLVTDLAFLPLEVLVVTVIVDRLLSERDRRLALEKLNMVIGAFFSEVGTELLRRLCAVDPDSEEKRKALKVDAGWSDKEYRAMEGRFTAEEFKAESRAADLVGLRELLVEHRDFMVRLLENPMLLEHATFTDLLWAVSHLTEELESRSSLEGLPAADLDHLSGDMARAYGRVAVQWLDYMRHLKENYPYLFSLAIRLNPFDPEAQVEFS